MHTAQITAILLGLTFVTLIDVVGSITSRKLNYPYVYLTPLSFAVYTFIGYYASQGQNVKAAILSAALVGVFDGTVGWKIALALNANFGKDRERALQLDTVNRIIIMLIVGAVFGLLGLFIANFTS